MIAGILHLTGPALAIGLCVLYLGLKVWGGYSGAERVRKANRRRR